MTNLIQEACIIQIPTVPIFIIVFDQLPRHIAHYAHVGLLHTMPCTDALVFWCFHVLSSTFEEKKHQNTKTSIN